MAARVGMRFQLPRDECLIAYSHYTDLINLLNQRTVVAYKAKFALIIFDGRNAQIYSAYLFPAGCVDYANVFVEAIKQWGDVNKGMATQGLLFTTISKAVKQGRVNQDTVFNLLLKINVKMGGANWKFSSVV